MGISPQSWQKKKSTNYATFMPLKMVNYAETTANNSTKVETSLLPTL